MKNSLRIIALVCFCSSSLMAQESLPSDTFRVVKNYQPTLVNANKISFDPEIDDDLKLDIDLTYSFLNKQVPVSFEVEPISPAKIKGEPLVKLYNGYARVGVGNSLIPFAEVYYNNLRSKKYALGGHAKYFNMAEANRIKGSDMSEMHFEAFGKRFWKRNTLSSSVSFNKRDFNYYGYYNIVDEAEGESISSSLLEQRYNRLNGKVQLKSTKVDSFNLRHTASLEYNLLSNKEGNAENNIKTDVNLSQFYNSELLNLDVGIDYNSYELGNDNTIISLRPKVSTIGERFRIAVGLGVYLNSCSSTKFHFYPVAEIKYNVIEDILVPYVGVNGQIKRVNYNSITLENPFVSENIALQNTNEKMNLYAGFRGTLSKRVSFNLSSAFVRTENAYFYVQLADSNQYVSKEYFLTYDGLDELKFKGEVVVRMSEKLTLYGLGEYSSFSTDNEIEAWHRPALRLNVSGKYNLRNKVLIGLDLIYWGEQFARDINFPENGVAPTEVFAAKKLDGIVDANLSFEYRYTKRLSAFVKFNNIAGIKFEKYKDYPTQGFNVWGGFIVRFLEL